MQKTNFSRIQIHFYCPINQSNFVLRFEVFELNQKMLLTKNFILICFVWCVITDHKMCSDVVQIDSSHIYTKKSLYHLQIYTYIHDSVCQRQ